jgi:chloramphenicol 3-O phosphotransferase
MPATPVGDQLSWVVGRLLLGLTDEAEIAEHFAPAFVERFPIEMIMSIGQRAVSFLGDIDVVQVDTDGDLRATVTLAGSTGLRAVATASVEPLPPYRLEGLGFAPAPAPPSALRTTRHVIVLNGVSSSGKSTLARALQASLDEPWLHVEVDAFLAMLPMKGFAEIVAVARGANAAVAALAREGNRVIYDCVLSGELVDDLRAELVDAPTLWVGVHCAAAVLAERERVRGDRMVGQARAQLAAAHKGISYDLEVDTTEASAEACAFEVTNALLGRR